MKEFGTLPDSFHFRHYAVRDGKGDCHRKTGI